MNDSEKDDPVWKLLGDARRVEIDPFFSRNVTREIRNMREHGVDREGVLERLFSLFRRPAMVGVAAAVLVLAFVFVSTETAKDSGIVNTGTPVEAASEFNPTDEIESIGYLGELMTISDPADLDDSALAELSLLASR